MKKQHEFRALSQNNYISVLFAASYYYSHLFSRPVLQIVQHGMRSFLTRSRERFVCRCWSPRIHRRFCCSRRWLSRSPRVNIFGQRLSCGSCWCCPRVNRGSWFGTCKKSQREYTSMQFYFGKLSLEIDASYESLLPINTKHE